MAVKLFKPKAGSIAAFNKDGIAIKDIKNIEGTDAILVTYKDNSQKIFENYNYFINHIGYKEAYNPKTFESVNTLIESTDINVGDIIYYNNEFIIVNEELKNKLEALTISSIDGVLDPFNDGSCIFYAPLTNNEKELINNTPVNVFGNITFDKSLGALNNTKNNTNAINYKNVNIPTTEFTISCFLKETKKDNTKIVTAVEFRQNFPTIYTGAGSKDRKISFGSRDGGDGLGVVEVDFGKMYHVVYMVKKIDDKNTKVIGYLDGKKVIEETRNASISARSDERILLFQESDGTDSNGWDSSFDASQCFIGYIKHLRIFNRLLTNEEIKKLAKEQSTVKKSVKKLAL